MGGWGLWPARPWWLMVETGCFKQEFRLATSGDPRCSPGLLGRLLPGPPRVQIQELLRPVQQPRGTWAQGTARHQPSGLERCAGRAWTPPPPPRQTEGQGWHPGDVGSCWDLPRRGLSGMSQVSEPVDTWAGWSGVKHLVLSSDTGKARAPGLCPLVSPPGEESSPPRRPAPCGDACFAQQALQCLGGLRLSAPVVKPWWRWS